MSWTLATVFVYSKLEKGSRPRLNIQASTDASRVEGKGATRVIFLFGWSTSSRHQRDEKKEPERDPADSRRFLSFSFFLSFILFPSLWDVVSFRSSRPKNVFVLGGNITFISCKSLDYNDGIIYTFFFFLFIYFFFMSAVI